MATGQEIGRPFAAAPGEVINGGGMVPAGSPSSSANFGAAAAVALSPDGTMLATGTAGTGSAGGAVRLRDVSYLASPLAQLCARLGGSVTPAEWARYVPGDAAYRNAC